MNDTGKLTVTTPSDREVAIVRTFDAPRHLVYRAFTEPELMKRWLSGMEGWEMSKCEMDLRPGGAYRWEWRNLANGTSMGVGGTIREISPERIVMNEIWDEDWTGGGTISTIEFREENGRTTTTQTLLYSSKEARDEAMKTGMTDGVEMSYARLDAIFVSESH